MSGHTEPGGQTDRCIDGSGLSLIHIFSLERALRRLSIIYEETEELHNKIKPNRELCELRNMIAVAYLVIKQGSALKESVGCHYNSDYPKPDNK